MTVSESPTREASPVRLRVTMTFEYDAKPESYEGCSTSAEMAQLDQSNFEDDWAWLWESACEAGFKVVVEPAESDQSDG